MNKLRRFIKRYFIQRGFFPASPETAQIIKDVLDRTQEVDGHYYEFGVFRGYSFYTAVINSPGIYHFGFDSFAGLPSSEGPWKKRPVRN